MSGARTKLAILVTLAAAVALSATAAVAAAGKKVTVKR
jgi:hypothetical protein